MHTFTARIATYYAVLIAVSVAAAGLIAEGSERGDGRIAALLALVTLLAVVAGGALAVVLGRTFSRPLRQLQVAALKPADGTEARPAVPAVSGIDVIDDLVRSFNQLHRESHQTISTLTHQRERLEALLAASADALIALDSAGVVRYLNPAATALLGDAGGRPLAESARQHELTSLVQTALKDKQRASTSIYLDRRDAWVQATVSPILPGNGWAALMILHDISDVRRAESTRRDFVANVSHELRTPLAGIKAVVETLRDGAMHDPTAADDFLGRVDAEVDRLVQLVEELLQLARVESGAAMDLSTVRPRAMLEECIERFQHTAERAEVVLTLDAPTNLPAIVADPARLGQAVGNLVHNALKFTPSGGSVTVRAVTDREQLRITVTDSGSGIDAADLPRIFERFYVADRARGRHGTGLGLAIVKHIVRAHGGTVEASSSPGRGSTFSITLPLQPGQ